LCILGRSDYADVWLDTKVAWLSQEQLEVLARFKPILGAVMALEEELSIG
jgi:hypothetical protein